MREIMSVVLKRVTTWLKRVAKTPAEVSLETKPAMQIEHWSELKIDSHE
jgi:hypothetical protein